MAVNFEKNECKTYTQEEVFGICDDLPSRDIAVTPAYLDFDDSDNWIAWVENDKKKQVVFTAIDHCIKIERPRLDQFRHYYAYVCNKQRPYFYAANNSFAEQFEDNTGFLLIVEQVIKIR